MAKKTRITLYLDPAIVDGFRVQAVGTSTGYQTLINAALRHTLNPDTAPHDGLFAAGLAERNSQVERQPTSGGAALNRRN